MNWKPYFYYRQQYPALSQSDEDGSETIKNLNKDTTKDTTGEANSIAAVSEQAAKIKQANQLKVESCKEESQEPVVVYEHSRFKQVAPGVFQFKPHRPHMPAPEGSHHGSDAMAWKAQLDKKQELNGFVKIGMFPANSSYGLPIYQFT